MFTTVLYSTAGLILVAYAVDFLLSFRDDPQEPRCIRPMIPLIGHILGLFQYGPAYYNRTSAIAGSEIYTLTVANFKVYISASSRLLPLIQKHSKALSFRPFLQLTARKYGDATKATYEIFGGALPDDLSHAVKMSLAPGPFLDDLVLRMGERVLVDIDALLKPDPKPADGVGVGDGARRFRLLEWARHAVVQATSCAVYGRDHPFLEPDVEQAYWGWMTYLTAHLVGWLDFTGRGYTLRRRVFDAHFKYCKTLPPSASHLMREHQRTLADAGVAPADRAKQAAIFTIASFSNSAPTLYWTLWELYSRLDVVAAVREELEMSRAVTARRENGDGFVLDVAALKTRCPLLLSVLQETQRTRHVNPSFRKVLADTLLDGRYLLKAGRYLQVPGNVIHHEPKIWGDSAAVFDAYRFVKREGGERGKHINDSGGGDPALAATASGFVPWGAAPYLCPARQFATTEILIVAALLVMRADIRPACGTWERNPALKISDLSTLSPPRRDIEMEVSIREAWAGTWSLRLREARSRVPLASG